MKTTETSVLTADGVRLSVSVYEAETPEENPENILLLHGWPNAGTVWAHVAKDLLLADPRLRLIAPTFRGYGASDRPESGYTCSQFADDILSVVGGMDLSEFSLVGHSMGGKIAQVIASRNPAGLQRLGLVCPVPLIAAPVSEENKTAQRAIYGDDARLRDFFAAMTATPLNTSLLEELIVQGQAASQAAFLGWIDTMREEDYSDALPNIPVRTLVLHGSKDPLRTEELLRATVAEPISGATFAVIPNVGHLPHLEDPTSLALLLVNFLK